ncbi:hypothetical protein HOY82DRAFT_614215 [Tuber indicum]|nr:hypothetical protein HOY82DRAFT_614215 [Tuber indicum]
MSSAIASQSVPAPSNPSPPRAGRPSHPRPTTYTGLSPTVHTTVESSPVNPSQLSHGYSGSVSPGGPPIPPPPRTSSQRQGPAVTSPPAASQVPASTERSKSSSGRTRGQSTDGREREKTDRDRERDRRRAEENKLRRDQPPPAAAVGRSNSTRDSSRNVAGSSSSGSQQPVDRSPSTRRRQDAVDGAGASTSGQSRSRREQSGNGGLAVVNPDGNGTRPAGTRKETRFGEYILGQTLGEGEFGKVKLGWRRDGGVQVAIKLIRRDSLSPHPNRLSKIHREISILRTLSHPNIVRLHEMVETDRHIGIILEYASGGELFDYILNHRFLKDPPACRLFAQLVSGVGYLHKKGIVHRDLKLENLLLDRNRNIIITDFGFANVFDPRDELGELEDKLEDPEILKELEKGITNSGSEEGSLLSILGPGQVRRRGDLMATSCGSPCYAAPELVVSDGLYTGRKVDVWSCGVILYAMLAGYLPFDDDPANPEGDNINLLYKYIVSTPLTFPEYVSPHARDLLRRMLVPEPRKRADLFEVARHSWLSPFANVVSLITSSTTGVKEVEHVTINEPTLDGPSLVRSASVREPSSTNSHPHPTSLGGLGPRHHAHENVPQAAQSKPVSDAKRRTVQVEYVEPRSQTKRGSAADPDQGASSEDAAPAPFVPTNKHNDGVTRAATTAGIPSRHQRTMSSDQQQKPRDQLAQPSGSSAQPPRTRPSSSHPQAPARAATTAGDGAGSGPPSRRPSRDRPGPQFNGKVFTPTEQTSSNSARPNTANSINSNRLPSRGIYSRPVAPSLAANNAQGRIAMPKAPKPYTISNPIPQPDNSDAIGAPASAGEMGKPSTTVSPMKYSGRPSPPAEQSAKGHKRANTIGSGGASRFLGGLMGSSSSQDNTSRPTMTGAGEPRPSVDQGGRSKYEKTKEGKVRRFSLLPTSFSLRSISGSGSEGKHERRPSRSASGLRVGQFINSKSQPQTSSHPQLSVPNAGEGGSVRTGSDTSLAVGGSAPASAAGGNYARESIDLGAGNANAARRPAVLQKNRKFTEGDAGGTGGSSGPARRVMDFFRRRGVARSSKGDA